MEKDTPELDNPEGRYLNRQAELLYDLTIRCRRYLHDLERVPKGTCLIYLERTGNTSRLYNVFRVDLQTIGALNLIREGAYKYMKGQGRQDWADDILVSTSE